MSIQMTTIMLGVRDFDRAKKFYAEGLGCTVQDDYPGFVTFSLGDGSSTLALCDWDQAATDAGLSPVGGSGFRGVSFHYIVDTRREVDEVMSDATAAGANVVMDAAAAQWGYCGYFADPDGHLWKVATSATE